MPKLIFKPGDLSAEVSPNIKILAAAIRNKIPIRFGCAACQCGTCCVAVDAQPGNLSPMDDDEKRLLDNMSIVLDGSKRLACKTKILDGTVAVDLDFQNLYDPDKRKF